MRQLSQERDAAQEEERRHLSRELHDHVAQVLTALRMELGRIERTRAPADIRVGAAVAECKRLVDSMFRTVRDLTLGLRPSMLDDFGLQAALEWLVRDFNGRYAVNVDLHVDRDFDVLPDRYRTCVYRAVQEALTNCARHAKAGLVTVSLTTEGDQLQVSVTDDGIGFDVSRRGAGLGLRGIEERVKELQGVMTIARIDTGGTRLAIQLPAPIQTTEVPLARAAG
jgi:signal transduction histidine kinase